MLKVCRSPKELKEYSILIMTSAGGVSGVILVGFVDAIGLSVFGTGLLGNILRKNVGKGSYWVRGLSGREG